MSTISVDVGVCAHCGKVFKEDSEDTFAMSAVRYGVVKSALLPMD